MKVNKSKIATSTATAATVPAAAPAPVEEVKFQHYKSSRKATKMVTTEGLLIKFIDFTYYTADPRVIAYLDNEIALGLNIITKGELLTKKESDPMEVLKAAHIAEYLAAQEQTEAKEDFGSSESGAGSAVLNPASTAHINKMAAESSGAASK